MSRTGFIQNEMDLKLLVLYIMDRAVAPITFLQLLDLALCDAGVDYFSLTEAVNHLTETEHLSLNGELYSITEKGRRNIEICQSSLPYSVRLRCDENLVKLNDALMRQAQVQTGLQPNEDGTCTVRLYLADEAGPLMELKLISPLWPRGRRSPVSSSSPLRPSTTRSWLCWYAIPRKNLIHLPNKKRKNSRKHLACGCFCFRS